MMPDARRTTLRRIFGTSLCLMLLAWTPPALADDDDDDDDGGAKVVRECGDVLSKAGSYRLDRDLVCDGLGIEITASKVRLDLAGHSITCVPSNPDTATPQEQRGIWVRDVSRVVVKNGTVSGCNVGVFLLGTEKSRVQGMTLVGNDFDPTGVTDPSGLLLNSANANAIIRNTMSANGHGISLFDSSGNWIVRNQSSDNGPEPGSGFDGLRLLPLGPEGGSHFNKILRNEFDRNYGLGIQWSGPSIGNFVSRNTANDNEGFGVLVYGFGAEFPVPAGNWIKRNTALRNLGIGFFPIDLLEVDFTAENFLLDECQNTWKKNTFDVEFGPPMCIR